MTARPPPCGRARRYFSPRALKKRPTSSTGSPPMRQVPILARFQAMAKKSPHKTKAEVLAGLVAHTPGEEGKWFAVPKSADLFDEAIALAIRTPCSPPTLTRAVQDFDLRARSRGDSTALARGGLRLQDHGRRRARHLFPYVECRREYRRREIGAGEDPRARLARDLW